MFVGGNQKKTIPNWFDPERTDADVLDTCVFDAADDYLFLQWDGTNHVTIRKTCTWTDVD